MIKYKLSTRIKTLKMFEDRNENLKDKSSVKY